MELEEYISDTIYTRLLVRMALHRTHQDFIGGESVIASLVTRHRDKNADMLVHVTYDCFPGAVCGDLNIITRAHPLEYPDMTFAIARMWDSHHEWDRFDERVCTLFSGQRYVLAPSNVLVLQHLSRIMGIIGSEYQRLPGSHDPRSLPLKTRAVGTLLTRLQSIIVNGNNDLMRLTAVG